MYRIYLEFSDGTKGEVDLSDPHFHAVYGEHEALVEILTSEIIEGSLPLGARSLVNQWGCHAPTRTP